MNKNRIRRITTKPFSDIVMEILKENFLRLILDKKNTFATNEIVRFHRTIDF